MAPDLYLGEHFVGRLRSGHVIVHPVPPGKHMLVARHSLFSWPFELKPLIVTIPAEGQVYVELDVHKTSKRQLLRCNERGQRVDVCERTQTQPGFTLLTATEGESRLSGKYLAVSDERDETGEGGQ